MGMMGELARSDDYDPNAVDWSRMNQPFGTLTDPNPVQYSAAGGLVQIRPSDVNQATDMAMGFSGGGLSTKPIKAYHSSPHDFDRFDLSKIGTGEGAQVYGHGLYFAENPAVSGQGGQYWTQFLKHPSLSQGEREAAEALSAANFDRQRAIEPIRRASDNLRDWVGMTPYQMEMRGYHPSELNKMKGELAAQEDLIARLSSGKPVGPRTYEVNINADPAHMLDWDKPLREQQNIADIIRANPRNMDEMKGPIKRKAEAVYGGDIPADVSGSDAYTLMRGYREPARASAALREAGIPGIKYLDEGSRNKSSPYLVQKMLDEAKAGLASAPTDKIDWHMRNVGLHERMLKEAQSPLSSNYVIFDPSIIDITKKYAVPGALSAGGMGALAAQDQYQGE
jgi:hypothetical protein